ncbi:MAG: sugar phosphate nucleotidyltransferase, partial [Solirubrobacteraceae bacterium MAG38_C4-C5]|nr:sugar phosphate nucleotidyltransferase [Candidatus Siliceabacter maunaloa]
MPLSVAVVPVAGLGTRLLPATKSQPKEMLPVGVKPVVQHVVEELAGCGIERIVLVTGRGKHAIEDHFDPDPRLVRALREEGKEELLARLGFERGGPQIAYVRQPRPLGLGDAVGRAAGLVPAGEAFAVALGDAIIGCHRRSDVVARLGRARERYGAVAAIAVEEVPAQLTSRYGIVAPAGDVDGDGAFPLADLVEKPSPAEAASRLAIAGRYVLMPEVLAVLERTPPGLGGEVQLTDALRALLREGRPVVGGAPGRRRAALRRGDGGELRDHVRRARADRSRGGRGGAPAGRGGAACASSALAPFSAAGGAYLSCSGQGVWISSS